VKSISWIVLGLLPTWLVAQEITPSGLETDTDFTALIPPAGLGQHFGPFLGGKTPFARGI